MSRLCLLLLLAGCGGDAPMNAPPDLAPTNVGQPCDPLAQDCASGKCTIVAGTDGNQRACVAATGSITEGQPCTRTAEGLGHDDCAPGLFCSFINELPPEAGGTRYCRRLCHRDGDCAMGERCASADDFGDGLCTRHCVPFADCGQQMSCSDLWSDTSGLLDLILVCRVPGMIPIGGACMTHYECAADSVCIDPAFGDDTRCRALCDANHPCASGACQMFGGAGYCN
jgi:hypothetical protein